MATKEGGSAKLTWSTSHQVILKLWSSDNVVVLNSDFDAAVLPDGMMLYDDDGDVGANASLQNVGACYSIKYKGDHYHFKQQQQTVSVGHSSFQTPILC